MNKVHLPAIVNEWTSTEDEEITCIVCDKQSCDLERTFRNNKPADHNRFTVGLHGRCLNRATGPIDFWCSKCNHQEACTPHECPYDKEIGGNRDMCNCCEYCEDYCASDI